MKMTEAIESLYPESAESVVAAIESLVSKYQSTEPPQKHPLSQSDAIMITYGDSFQDELGTPLDCLRRFACEQLGDCISAIHLLPCFPYTSDDGFSVLDYYQIAPNLGDWDDVGQIGNSYELMFDAVVNHISQHSSWFKGFLNEESDYHDFFIVGDPDADYSQVTRPRALPLLHPYKRGDETVHVWTTFSDDQVDLNFSSPNVFLAVLDVLLFYVSKGARYIRLDAIAFIWKQLGTTCMHLPETHRIIQVYRQIIEQVDPNVAIITETNVPHDENVSYFGNGHDEAHLVYNFTLPPLLMHSLHGEDVTVLTNWAKSLSLPSKETCFFNFTASHDGVGVRPLQGIVSDAEIERLADIAKAHGGFVSMRDNGDGTQSPYEINCNYLDFATSPEEPDATRVQRFMLTQSVMLAMPGVPGIYYHSIVGSENDRQAAIESGINRRINRAKLDYGELAPQLSEPGALREQVFSRYKSLLSRRRQCPAFNPFGDAEYENQGAVFAIKRQQDGQTVFALHNFSAQAAEFVGLPNQMIDMLNGEAVEGGAITLGPFEYRWLQ